MVPGLSFMDYDLDEDLGRVKAKQLSDAHVIA